MNYLRLKMDGEEVSEQSRKIIDKLITLPKFQQAKIILFYYPLDNEVDLRELIDYSLQQKKVVVLPAVNGNDLDLYVIKDPANDLEQGHFRILEPKKSCERIGKDQIDLSLVPGVAFDKDGNRVGRGKGYYDRFLKDSNALKVGVAYEFQMTKRITPREHDVPLDLIVTEMKIRGRS